MIFSYEIYRGRGMNGIEITHNGYLGGEELKYFLLIPYDEAEQHMGMGILEDYIQMRIKAAYIDRFSKELYNEQIRFEAANNKYPYCIYREWDIEKNESYFKVQHKFDSEIIKKLYGSSKITFYLSLSDYLKLKSRNDLHNYIQMELDQTYARKIWSHGPVGADHRSLR